MLFGQYLIDKTIEEHIMEIAALADDPQTLVFFDTNILTYLYKLHEDARLEFFQWSASVTEAKRLAIPAWVASEYLSQVASRKLGSYTPQVNESKQVKKLLDGLLETASLFVDDTSLKTISYAGDRKKFIADFSNAIDALARFTSVFSQSFDSGVIHQQIDAHLSSAILSSDLAKLCAQANRDANGRVEHRLPPGFRDEGKPENRLGDLIIWFEILEKSALDATKFPKVLFVTRDEKSDWVYAPEKRVELVRGERKAVANAKPQIKLTDPRLVAEFAIRAGHKNFVISNLLNLVEGLSRRSSAEFRHLAAAIQINTQEPTSVTETSGLESRATVAASDSRRTADLSLEPSLGATKVTDLTSEISKLQTPVTRQEPIAPPLQYDAEAMQDSQYPVDAPSEINAIIGALASHNWYTQNPAVMKVRTIRSEEFPSSSWFVLGRNLYQAACGNSQRAIEFMAALDRELRQFPPKIAQHLLAGMLFEIYFDSKGQLREVAKFGYADNPLLLVAEDDYAQARDFIRFHLKRQNTQLKYWPGESVRKTVRIEWTTAQPPLQNVFRDPSDPSGELRSVVLDGAELLQVVRSQNVLEQLMRPKKLSPERIREKISEKLFIPKWSLTLDTEPPMPADRELSVPNGKVLFLKQVFETP